MKIFILILVLTACVTCPAHAFISPGTLSLLAAAMGSVFWAFATIIAVNAILFFKGLKFKRVIRWISAIALVALSAIVISRTIELKKMNTDPVPDISVNPPKGTADGKIDTARTYDSSTLLDEVPLAEYELDLNKVTRDDLAGYRMFQIGSALGPLVSIKGAGMLENEYDLKFVEDLPNAFANIEKFAAENRLSRDDKILFICRGGSSSAYMTILFNNAGYHANFAMLASLKDNNDLFVTPYAAANTKTPEIVLVPYSWRDKNKKDGYLAFKFVNPGRDLTERERQEFIILRPERFDASVPERFNVVCFSNLHCLITKYFLDHNGIRKATIYKYPFPPEKYRDWDRHTLEMLKQWKP